MKLISDNLLGKLRRGAEKLYQKHQNNLIDKELTIRQDIAEELGLEHSGLKPEPIEIGEKIGLFDDEAKPEVEMPMVMARVKLSDYIEALKNYGTEETDDDAATDSNDTTEQ